MVEIDLKRFVKILYKRKKVCIIIFLTCILMAIVYSFFLLQPEYQSTSKVSIKSDNISIIDFVKSDEVFEECVYRIENNEIDLQFLKEHTKISFRMSNNTLDFLVSTKDGKLSELIGKKYLEALEIKLEEVYDIKSYTVIEEPTESTLPSNVNHIEDILKAIIISCILIFLYGIIKYMCNDSIADLEIIEKK